MRFVQIVEFTSSNIEEMRERATQYNDESGAGRSGTGLLAADRDNPGRYFVIAEFESYEAAMENSERPETQALAADMARLADGPPTFYNLDVVETFD